MKFAFPTLGKEPDFVVLNKKDFMDLANNSIKRFPWGGTVGLYYTKADGSILALKGVCSHMECNVDYKPAESTLTELSQFSRMAPKARLQTKSHQL
jgi:Rieske Fe-S protein